MKRYIRSDEEFRGYLDEYGTPVYVDDKRTDSERTQERIQIAVEKIRRVLQQCIDASQDTLQKLQDGENRIQEIADTPYDPDDDESFPVDLDKLFKIAYNLDDIVYPYLKALDSIDQFIW